jgi:hypothetical protein
MSAITLGGARIIRTSALSKNEDELASDSGAAAAAHWLFVPFHA